MDTARPLSTSRRSLENALRKGYGASVISLKALLRLAALLCALLLLSGCLTLESTIRMENDGSGELDLTYSISEELFDYGVFDDEASRRVLPVSRNDFELAALAAEGVRLIDHGIDRGEGVVTVSARLAFSDPGGLASLLNVDADELVADGGRTLLRQPLFPGFEGAIDTAMVQEFWSEVRFVHRVRAPRTIESVNLGEIVDGGREARVDLRLIELIEVGEPVVWEVAW